MYLLLQIYTCPYELASVSSLAWTIATAFSFNIRHKFQCLPCHIKPYKFVCCLPLLPHQLLVSSLLSALQLYLSLEHLHQYLKHTKHVPFHSTLLMYSFLMECSLYRLAWLDSSLSSLNSTTHQTSTIQQKDCLDHPI